jgi:hypothetical protein
MHAERKYEGDQDNKSTLQHGLSLGGRNGAAVCARSAGKDEKCASRSLARAWCRQKRLVWARPDIKVSENAGAGYGRKSRRGTR